MRAVSEICDDVLGSDSHVLPLPTAVQERLNVQCNDLASRSVISSF
jgi:hypothetical protein